jgi:hypothetical protein
MLVPAMAFFHRDECNASAFSKKDAILEIKVFLIFG